VLITNTHLHTLFYKLLWGLIGKVILLDLTLTFDSHRISIED